jgi:hypothetical protein
VKRQSKKQSRTQSKNEPKLRLKRETVRVLTDDHLEGVVGGQTTWHCMVREQY